MEDKETTNLSDHDLLINSHADLKWLRDKLYGKNGMTGHVPEIVAHLALLNGKVARNSNGVLQLRILLSGATLALVAGILKLFGVY